MESEEERIIKEIKAFTLRHGRFQFLVIEGIRTGFVRFENEFQCAKFQCICLN